MLKILFFLYLELSIKIPDKSVITDKYTGKE